MRLACLLLALALISAGSAAFADELKWDPVQTYTMIALDPEKAVENGVTVNGLWGAFGMPEAVRTTTHVTTVDKDAPITWSYATPKEYVDACHKVGVLVPATLMGIAGYPPLRARFPEMENGACVGADGKRAYWNPPSGYFMCVNNPIYQNVLLTIGKEAIDAGVDLIVIDEIQGNETCFYWSNEPGFCDHCLTAYREHLSSKYTPDQLKKDFDIDDLAKFDFAKRLGGQRAKPWPQTAPLFKELWRLQERRNFESRSKLVGDLRAHMKEANHVIPICGNVPEVGLGPFNGGHRLPGLKYSLILDFLAFENGKQEATLPPRGKWAAYERLAASAFRLPSATTMVYDPLHKMEMDSVAGKDNRSIFFYYLMVEANANGSAFINYFQPRFFPQSEPFWDPCFRAQKFIRDHSDLFEPKSETGADVALLYIENEAERFRALSYLGFAQALVESNVPFDVITDGGDGFLPAKLTEKALSKYRLVIPTEAIDLDPAQKKAVEDYVTHGGTVLTSDPETFGLASGDKESAREKGKIIVLPKTDVPGQGPCDLGLAYQTAYADSVRQQIAGLVKQYGGSTLDVSGADVTVSVYPRYQPEAKRILLHVVNSDYDPAANQMRPKKDLTIRLKQPEFYKDVREARILSPDFQGEAATAGVITKPAIKDGYIEVTVPNLDVYNIVVL